MNEVFPLVKIEFSQMASSYITQAQIFKVNPP